MATITKNVAPAAKPEQKETKLPVISSNENPNKAGERKLTATKATIEEKMDIVEELQDLMRKRELITASISDVSNFYISPSGGCQMRVTDSNNKTFSISHPGVINEVLTQVTFKLEEELKSIEARFLALY